jgi:hypothetical protein
VPQLALSVCVSTHALPHAVAPASHVGGAASCAPSLLLESGGAVESLPPSYGMTLESPTQRASHNDDVHKEIRMRA